MVSVDRDPVRPPTRLPQDRVEIALAEVGYTTVTSATARWLVLLFLSIIGLAWTSEVVHQAATDRSGFAALIGTPVPDPAGSAWDWLLQLNRAALAGIERFEQDVSDESLVARLVRPPVQLVATAALAAGTEQVHIGRDGWLFYAADMGYVTGPGFLDEPFLGRRASSGDTLAAAPAPDPRPALLDLHGQLAARGITLIVMPTPVKPSIHPERLDADLDALATPVDNRSYDAFVEQLRRHGVLVFDTAAVVAEARRERASPLYLATDTHWRPETVAIVAERLAAFVREHVGLPRRDPLAYVAHDVQVENHGDTALLLALPRRSRLYPPEAVVTRQIRMADGSAWQNDAAADVLLLGDSFSNIYAVRGMGWGEAAGLAEQLSFVLRRPVQRLAQNDAGALAPRRMLAARIARGAAPANTRVVIYQFASRELVDGDWKLINLAG